MKKIAIHILLLIFMLIFIIGCKQKESKTSSDVYYTCSMDPQVIETKPGKCPICKMPLTAVKKVEMQNVNELKLSDQQIQLGNITVDSLKEHILGEEFLITGLVNVNQNKVTTVSSRVMGRIEKLYIKNVGETISKGEPLYELYSEDLAMAIKELLLAIEKGKALKNEQVDMAQIIKSIRYKLSLYGLSDEQINDLSGNPNPSNVIKILSPVNGVVTSVDKNEGDYVMEGGSVFSLADFNSLWIEGQVYSDYLNYINQGMLARITYPSFPGKIDEGRISFINPEFNPSTKINTIRIVVNNENGDLKPGMQAYMTVLTHETKSLALPTDAIIIESKGSTVWIKTGPNVFKSIMVTTGLEANGYTEIKSGLSKGDVVVTKGAYLLNSEFIFKHGSNPMEGHDM